MKGKIILQTNLPGEKLFARGKVRDTWESQWPGRNSERLLLMITTDRLSAFDAVMSRGVPELGKLRNQISLFWFEQLKDICPNHIYSGNQQVCAGILRGTVQKDNDLLGRCALVYGVGVFPVECIVRGYITGSGWKNYQKDGTVCGIKLSAKLREADKLLEPIFTPTTKAKTGHDIPITFDEMVSLVGGQAAEAMREKSVRLYKEADKFAEACGIIIADTKFEFGLSGKDIILVDELLTPDSSRLWDKALYEPGGPQLSLDKQPVRDWLKLSGWNKKPPPPPLPDEVVEKTRERYVKAYERLTGNIWPPVF